MLLQYLDKAMWCLFAIDEFEKQMLDVKLRAYAKIGKTHSSWYWQHLGNSISEVEHG